MREGNVLQGNYTDVNHVGVITFQEVSTPVCSTKPFLLPKELFQSICPNAKQTGLEPYTTLHPPKNNRRTGK